MAHEGIFATLAECTAKAGENVDVTGFVEANINDWCAQAESYINIVARNNFSDGYAGLNADVKRILSEAASNLVGIYAITYNMAGYSSIVEVEDMLNILWARLQQCIDALKSDQKGVTFMNDA